MHKLRWKSCNLITLVHNKYEYFNGWGDRCFSELLKHGQLNDRFTTSFENPKIWIDISPCSNDNILEKRYACKAFANFIATNKLRITKETLQRLLIKNDILLIKFDVTDIPQFNSPALMSGKLSSSLDISWVKFSTRKSNLLSSLPYKEKFLAKLRSSHRMPPIPSKAADRGVQYVVSVGNPSKIISSDDLKDAFQHTFHLSWYS